MIWFPFLLFTALKIERGLDERYYFSGEGVLRDVFDAHTIPEACPRP